MISWHAKSRYADDKLVCDKVGMREKSVCDDKLVCDKLACEKSVCDDKLVCDKLGMRKVGM